MPPSSFLLDCNIRVGPSIVTRANGGRAQDRAWPIGKGGMAKGNARRVAQVLEEAATPTVAHLASHTEGSAHRDEDTKYDPD